MRAKVFRFAPACAAISVILLLLSCSSGPVAPQKGTPAFYWAAANETYAAGDYIKTVEHLDKILETDNEYTARAQPWLMLLESGMAKGYMELADYYEYGARAKKDDPTPFRRLTSQYRGFANRMALHFAETFSAFQRGKSDTVSLGFPYPAGSAAQVPALTKVATGYMPPGPEAESLQRRVLERHMLLTTCRAVGSPDDTAKAQEIFRAQDAKVQRPVFVTAMAGSLYDVSQLYGRQKLDEPDKVKLFCARAQEALKTVPESKEAKELDNKIQKLIKTSKVS